MKDFKVTMSKPLMVGLVGLGLLAGGAGYAYAKYWNVATANGVNISRIAYIQNLEKQNGKQVLEQMVQDTLIKSEAAKKGIKVEKKDVDEQIKIIEEKLKAQNATLDDALKAQGMTREDLDEQIKLQKIVTMLAKPNTEVSQAEIDKFLVDNKAALPKTSTKEELQKLAKDQLVSQATNKAISDWLSNLRKDAKIIYR